MLNKTVKGVFPFPGNAPFLSGGFTIVELVTTLVLLGILAAVAMPRFFDRFSYDQRGFQEDLLSSIRYAQKRARFSGCEIRVVTTAAGYALNQRTSCASGAFSVVVQRTGGSVIADNVPAGLALDAADFWFDSLGRPHDTASGALLAATLALNAGNRTLDIEAETGFSHW